MWNLMNKMNDLTSETIVLTKLVDIVEYQMKITE